MRKRNPCLRCGLPLFVLGVRFPAEAQRVLARNCRLPRIIVVSSIAYTQAWIALPQGNRSQPLALRFCSDPAAKVALPQGIEQGLRFLRETDTQYKQREPAAQARDALPREKSKQREPAAQAKDALPREKSSHVSATWKDPQILRKHWK